MNFPKAFVFDMDGTLIDSEPHQIKARAALYRKFSMPEDYEKNITVGTNKKIYWGKAKEEYNLPYTVDELIAMENEEIITYLIEHVIPPSTGLLDLLTYLKENNVKIACASSSTSSYVKRLLSYMKIDGFFTSLVCGDDKIPPKPNPDPYLLACKKLGVDPKDTYAVEDSYVGSLSATSAGLTCVGYIESEIAKGANLSLCSFTALTMNDILAHLKSLK